MRTPNLNVPVIKRENRRGKGFGGVPVIKPEWFRRGKGLGGVPGIVAGVPCDDLGRRKELYDKGATYRPKRTPALDKNLS